MPTCSLCPFLCELPEGGVGKCKVRGVVEGKVSLLTYGKVTTMIDGPIEQKPIYHFHPGMKVLSIGGSGCNLFCGYCQNFEISQVGAANHKTVSPNEVVEKALSLGCGGIAFTYSEPLVWFEYVLDVAIAARRHGLKTLLKTNGYADSIKFEELLEWIDAVNIDVKGSAVLYREVASIDLNDDPRKWVIIENLRRAWRMCHVEISTMVIPGYCDLDEVFDAVLEVSGPELPVHLLRFIPDFKMRDVPATPICKLEAAMASALKRFSHVYIDYAGIDAATRCLDCGEELVRRKGLEIVYNILRKGKCPKCGTKQNFMVE